jgi:hydrogenase maturation protease
VGVLAAQELEGLLAGRADVVTSSLCGLALLDVLSGYDAAVIIDALVTGRHPVGEVFEVDPAALRPVAGASAHFSGLPEMLNVAERVGLRFPARLRLFAIEVHDLRTVGGPMTPRVREALPPLCESVIHAIDDLERIEVDR